LLQGKKRMNYSYYRINIDRYSGTKTKFFSYFKMQFKMKAAKYIICISFRKQRDRK
jgi:hypothetical protein